MELPSVLAGLDGVAHLSELVARGIPARSVQRAATSGDLIRVRPGVYAVPRADPRVVAAARIGGRAAGATAAELRGFWAPPKRRLVVEVGRARRLLDPEDPSRSLDRRRDDIAVLWRRKATGRPVGISESSDLVRQVLLSEPVPFAIAILDSMLRRSATSSWDLEAAAERLPTTRRRLLRFADRRAESGTESVVRVLLALNGIEAVPQVRVPFTDLDRLDLLVGDRLVIECDSHDHHDDPAARNRDAQRDLALTALGFIVIRIRYREAMFDPAGVVSAVQTLLETGAARDPRAHRVAD